MGCKAIAAEYVQQALEHRHTMGRNEHLHVLIAGQNQERLEEGADGRMVEAVLQFIEEEKALVRQHAMRENAGGADHATAEQVQGDHPVKTNVQVHEVATGSDVPDSRIDLLQELNEPADFLANDQIADRSAVVVDRRRHVPGRNGRFVRGFCRLLHLEPVFPATQHGGIRVGVPIARLHRDVVPQVSPPRREKRRRRLTTGGTDAGRGAGAAVPAASRRRGFRIHFQFRVRRGDPESTANDGTTRMCHELNRLIRIDLMKQGLEMFEPINGKASPLLNANRDGQVGKAGQQKKSLQDRRLANIVGPEEDIEPAQTVEIELRQSPEAADLDAIEMMMTRHVRPALDARSEIPTRIWWPG